MDAEQNDKQRFDEWAILELMGHQKIAGRITEQTIGGASLIRVDVPAIDGQGAFTRFYGAAAVYSIQPTTEALVLRALQYMHVAPISVYIPPERPRRLPGETSPGVTTGPQKHDCIECGSPCTCPDAEECEGCELHDDDED